MTETPNRVAGRIALPAPTPPSKRVRVRRFETPAVLWNINWFRRSKLPNGIDRTFGCPFHQSMTLTNLTRIASFLCLAFPLVTGVADERKDASTNAADQSELERLERKWNEAHLRGDTAALDDLWADELVVTVPKMQVMNKAQSLAIWRTGRMKFERYETSDTTEPEEGKGVAGSQSTGMSDWPKPLEMLADVFG